MIESGKKVKFNYTLFVEGQVVDSSEGKEPLEYNHGEGKIIKGLERQLEGMNVGDKRDITVTPDEGYGDVDPKAFVEFPKENMADGVEPKVGMVLQVKSKTGQMLSGVISEVGDATLTLNFNHPLAGQELRFSIEIVDVQ